MNDNQNQYTQNYMIDFNDAINLVFKLANQLDTENSSAIHSLGRVLAQDIYSCVSIPAFNNSAMDGYAVNALDLTNASKDSPVLLELAGITAAGETVNKVTNSKNKAWKIMTGAEVPQGFDSIIPVENTKQLDNKIHCFSSVDLDAHIRHSGEDFVEHEKISSSGDIINANSIMAYAALGITDIKVYKKVDIAVFSTGKELVDDPKIALKAGQIRNSNKPFILDWFNGLPVNAYDAGTNYDEVELFELDLQKELDKNTPIIISSGAVSMGDFDFIPQTIIKLGGEIIFHKSKIKPGKPILFAKFPNGSLYFGLPGNPISAAIGLRFFVSTAIRKLLSLTPEQPIKSVINRGLKKKQGFRSILKANATINQLAQHQTTLLDGQESFKIKPLLKANGWAVINENTEEIDSGDLIDFYPSSMSWDK